MRRCFLSVCVALGAIFVLCSCAAVKNPRAGRFVVAVPKASFYKYGPAQSFGPDLALPKGQKLTLVEESYGFSRVMLDDGLTGYVATEDLAAAPPEPPPPTPPPRIASRRSGSFYSGPNRKSRPVEPVENASPLFDVFDVPLPANPDPAPGSSPAAESKTPPKFKSSNLKVR